MNYPRVVTSFGFDVTLVSRTPPSDLQVKVGLHVMGGFNPNEQVVNVAAVASHPDFDSTALFKDQAVLRLERPVQINEAVDVVCLPEPNSPPVSTQPGQSDCIATGWGLKAIHGR